MIERIKIIWKFAQSTADVIEANILRSSTYMRTLFLRERVRLFMNILKREGPKLLPWEIPEPTEIASNL